MLSHAEEPLRHGWCAQCHVSQPLDHGWQIKAAIETVLEFGKVAWNMFFPNRMKSARQRRLDVAEQRIHPVERGMLRGLAATAGHDRHAPAACGRHRRKAGQAIRVDDRVWLQTAPRIACNLALLEALHTTQVHFHRPTVLRRLNGSNERNLVVRPTAALTGQLATQVGVVHLDPLAEGALTTALQHHLHQLVFHPPGGVVFDPEVTRQLHRRDALLALGEQEDSEEPLGQRELCAVKDRPGGQRRLMVAFVALVNLAEVQRAAGGVTACRTHEALGPAQAVQCLLTLLLATVLIQKVSKAEPLLELNYVFAMTAFSVFSDSSVIQDPVAH